MEKEYRNNFTNFDKNTQYNTFLLEILMARFIASSADPEQEMKIISSQLLETAKYRKFHILEGAPIKSEDFTGMAQDTLNNVELFLGATDA